MPANHKADGKNPNNKKRKADLENQIVQVKEQIKILQKKQATLEAELRNLPK